MDFFKSVFADDPPPSDSDESQREDQREEEEDEDDSAPEPNPTNQDTDANAAWSFGGLIKTLATKSESVIQNYRRDLEDFGTGLKKETSSIREVASRAVKDLPSSLEVGASVAQESLESVGQAIDDIGSTVWKSTAGIIAHGRDALLASELHSSDNNNDDEDNKKQQLSSSSSRSLNLKPYSRFEAQVRAIQSDKDTYLEEPEDLKNYEDWKSEFALDNKGNEIENLMRENEAIGEIYEKIVPDKIEHESFWCRYFYRVHRLKEAEDARAKLVKRAISGEDDEDLSWDFDDDDEEEVDDKQENDKRSGSASKGESSGGNAEEEGDAESVRKTERGSSSSSNGGSCKDSDVSIVSRPEEGGGEEEEEDLGWDKIEGAESSDESKGAVEAADLRKRSAAEEDDDDEDLSWEVED
ncbi:hypothetical protein FNV43_RR01890 [Rhamnella rubrinervis]|uniref:BSD domain-containing protein n=1 Tax=Rhamnella rubrinervis TaxID=2594499 RepID=A0A8K0HS97_9ROSA|nr:hypothetical protein FNV43_RR01890 [Rhamnella rubrinervis]